MSVTESAKKLSAKKKKTDVLSASKSVKFQKTRTPLSEKKKFAKTPHSVKTPKPQSSPEENEDIAVKPSPKLEMKKRKLNFSTVNDASLSDSDVPADEPVKKTLKMTATPAKLPAKMSQTPSKPQLTPEEITKEKKERTIFVGNLPNTMTKDKIAKLFTKYGKVQTARIRCATLNNKAKNKKAGVILQQFEESSTISAFVKFTKLQEAQAALAMNGKVYKGHHLRVDMADPAIQPRTDKNKAIFVRNIPYTLSEDGLWKTFESCGSIVNVRLIRDRVTFKCRGMGYVNFTTSDAVELALKLDGTEIDGRNINVQRWVKKDLNAEKSKKGMAKSKKAMKAKGEEGESSTDFSGSIALPKAKKEGKKTNKDLKKKKKLAKILTQ